MALCTYGPHLDIVTLVLALLVLHHTLAGCGGGQSCLHGGTCNSTTGACVCKDGWRGVYCTHCPLPKWGPNCTYDCICNLACDDITGSCGDFTTQDSSSGSTTDTAPTGKPFPTGIAVGAVLGSIALFAIITLAILQTYVAKRRRQTTKTACTPVVQPDVPPRPSVSTRPSVSSKRPIVSSTPKHRPRISIPKEPAPNPYCNSSPPSQQFGPLSHVREDVDPYRIQRMPRDDENYLAPSTVVQPSSTLVQPPSTLVLPLSTLVQPSSTLVQPSDSATSANVDPKNEDDPTYEEVKTQEDYIVMQSGNFKKPIQYIHLVVQVPAHGADANIVRCYPGSAVAEDKV